MDQSKNGSAAEATRNLNTGPKKNIIDSMVASGHFGTFVSAIHAAGLTDELATKGPFTVFAPTDEAFKRLAAGGYDALVKDAGRLKAILNYHVVSGYFTANDVKSGDMMTLQGTSLTRRGVVSEASVSMARTSPRPTSLRRTASFTPSTRSFFPRTGSCWPLRPDDRLIATHFGALQGPARGAFSLLIPEAGLSKRLPYPARGLARVVPMTVDSLPHKRSRAASYRRLWVVP